MRKIPSVGLRMNRALCARTMLSTEENCIHLSDSWMRSSFPVAESTLQAETLLIAELLALDREQLVYRKLPDRCMTIVVAKVACKDAAVWRG